MTAPAPKTRRRTAKPVGEMRSDFEFCDRNRDGRIDSAEFAAHQAANRRTPAGSPTR